MAAEYTDCLSDLYHYPAGIQVINPLALFTGENKNTKGEACSDTGTLATNMPKAAPLKEMAVSHR